MKLGNPRYNSHKLGEPVKLFRNMPKTVWFIFPRRQLGESKAIVAVHWWFPWVPCLPCRPLPLKIQKHKDKDTTCFLCHPFMPLTVQQKQIHHRNTMMSKKLGGYFQLFCYIQSRVGLRQYCPHFLFYILYGKVWDTVYAGDGKIWGSWIFIWRWSTKKQISGIWEHKGMTKLQKIDLEEDPPELLVT